MKIMLSKIFCVGNIKRFVSISMVALMLVLASACSPEKEKKPSSSQANSSQSDSSSDVSSSDISSDVTDVKEESSDMDSSSPSTTHNNKTDDYDEDDITLDQEIENTIPIDANEIEPVVDPSNLMTNYKGYADKERNKRLNEILNTPNTLELYDVKGKIYYVSTSGNDANDGLTPETAIQTLAAVEGLPIKDGDAVLFERDCVWRMYDKFDCRPYVTYGSYGEGRKPMFLGSPKNFAQEIWKPSKKRNVWQINYMYAYPCGAFFDQGKEAGYLKTSMRALTANTHFFYDESIATLYLYCDKGNPSDVWEDIEFSQAGVKFQLSGLVNNVTVDNLAIRYTGQGGIGATYRNSHFTVTNCEIGFAGGAWYGDPANGLRYCNGIEGWCTGEYLKWDHNWIYQTFDTGMSPQGTYGQDFHDISMCNNLLEFNNCDIETWESHDTKPGKYYNYFTDNNICRFTSLGWGTRADDGGIRGIDGVYYGSLMEDQITGKFSFSNNIIDCPGRMIYNFNIHNKGSYDKWTRKNNVYYIKQSLRTTTELTFRFHWKDSSTRVTGHAATNEKDTKAAFAEFEPSAKVYWYK